MLILMAVFIKLSLSLLRNALSKNWGSFTGDILCSKIHSRKRFSSNFLWQTATIRFSPPASLRLLLIYMLLTSLGILHHFNFSTWKDFLLILILLQNLKLSLEKYMDNLDIHKHSISFFKKKKKITINISSTSSLLFTAFFFRMIFLGCKFVNWEIH